MTAKEHPIIFSGPMVRAILEGRKTQTRRVISKQPPDNSTRAETCHGPDCGEGWHFLFDGQYVGSGCQWHITCPYGQPGDRLWVRETFRHCAYGAIDDVHLVYPADGASEYRRVCPADRKKYRTSFVRSRPSIHMPRWASRIILEIVTVRVQRVQEISEVDAKAEGVGQLSAFTTPYRAGFKTLWDSINLKRGYGWDKNPWVWVIEFKRLEAGK